MMTIDELWRIPINQVSFGDVRAFCAGQHREHVLLDYKAQFSSRNPQEQIAKIISAFANTQGGIILWGVGENPARKDFPDPNPSGEKLGADPGAKIVAACAKQIDPSISPELSAYLTNPKDRERGFIVVRVPQGDLVPYMGNRHIYERVVDSSEPRAAGLETITHLLARRRLAEELGRKRRKAAGDRIERALRDIVSQQSLVSAELVATPFGIQLSAGPRFGAEVLCMMSEVQEKCRLAARKARFDEYLIRNCQSVPVCDGRMSHVPIADEQQALNVDVFGNVVLFDETVRIKTRGDEQKPYVNARTVAIRVAGFIRFTRELNELLGWRGPIESKLTFTGTRGVPLVFGRLELRDMPGTAKCPHDEIIEAEATMRYPDDATNAMNALFERLQWNWGVDYPESMQDIV